MTLQLSDGSEEHKSCDVLNLTVTDVMTAKISAEPKEMQSRSCVCVCESLIVNLNVHCFVSPKMQLVHQIFVHQ